MGGTKIVGFIVFMVMLYLVGASLTGLPTWINAAQINIIYMVIGVMSIIVALSFIKD